MVFQHQRRSWLGRSLSGWREDGWMRQREIITLVSREKGGELTFPLVPLPRIWESFVVAAVGSHLMCFDDSVPVSDSR